MKILALNSGSSSIKYQIFDSDQNFQLLKKGLAERIGQGTASISFFSMDQITQKKTIPLLDYHDALKALFSNINIEHIDAVGHRIVHGGEQFTGPILINKKVIQGIKELAKFSPLHCKSNVLGIEFLQKILPNAPQVAIFDTSAHKAMVAKAFLYAIPYEYYKDNKIRKYGFHGINHNYVAFEAAKLLNKSLNELKLITCHLGNGCSISAFENGHSIENSMGLTPLEGLVMGTRCGDIDPSIITYLIDEVGINTKEISDILNMKSGLFGLCHKTDMRDIIESAQKGDHYSRLAIEIFVYRIQKYIGGYIAALNGIDGIIFTGGIGENSPYIRSEVLKNFSYIQAIFDNIKNEKNISIFSSDHSKVKLMNIPANEEKVIAQQTHELLNKTLN